MIVRAYEKGDLDAMIQIWNEVVEEGVAFPQEEFLNHTIIKKERQCNNEIFNQRYYP